MLLDAKEKFLLKSALVKGVDTLYDCFVNRTEDKLITAESIEYLKAFVQYPPYECISVIRSYKNNHLFSGIWGEEYIECISLIAAYYLDRNEIVSGLLWADKAIRLVDYFAPVLDHSTREKVLYSLPASAMVCAFPKQYLQIPCERFYLDWELEDFDKCKRIYQNDNYFIINRLNFCDRYSFYK